VAKIRCGSLFTVMSDFVSDFGVYTLKQTNWFCNDARLLQSPVQPVVAVDVVGLIPAVTVAG